MQYKDRSVRPEPIAPALGNVPQELKEVRQWILWKYEWKVTSGAWAKVPYAVEGYRASSTDPDTWSDFEACSKEYNVGTKYDGLGFVFAADSPYIGVDLDVCVQEVGDTLELTGVADQICKGFASYTELSPSRTGIHIIGTATNKPAAAKGKWQGTDCEIYSKDRYFTFTGQVWEDYTELKDITQRATELSSLIKQAAAERSEATTVDRSLARALKDPYIKALFDGDLSSYEGDQSRADLALCSKLASYSNGSHDALDNMFRQSKLFREKWDERHGADTYGNITLAKALEGVEVRTAVKKSTKNTREAGRFTIDSMWDKVMEFREDGGARGFHPGWDILERYYRPTLGALTVMVGVPSSGKSSWIDCLVYNMAKRHGWRTTMASFESLPIERHINSLCQIHLQKPTYKFMAGHATDNEMNQARKELNNWFNFILPDDDEQTTDALLSYVQDDLDDFGIKGFVLDPFTELELPQGNGQAEVNTIGREIKKIQKFTRAREMHTWLLAHPTKGGETYKQEEKGMRPTLYSAAGAAAFRNKADFGLVIHRWDDDVVDMYVEKVRNAETTGGKGKVSFTYSVEQKAYLEVKEDKW